ncbi:MAG: insulinase family protein [Pararhodobacter sp.]|nr:insulinase family protein [Pararhodobacter sp.]
MTLLEKALTTRLNTAAASVLVLLLAATPLRAEIDITPVTSPGGIEAWLVEEPSIPFVAIEISFEGGTVLDPQGAEGSVALMTALLSEGAGELDAQGFAAATESLAAGISFDSGRDSLRLSIRALSENRDEVIALARSALMEPRFDESALQRERARQLAALERDARNPMRIATSEFDARAFADHPYARPVDGTPESVAALTRDDIEAAHRTALARDRLHIGAAGDITTEELGALLDDLLGDLPAEGGTLPEYAEFAAEPGITVIDHPGPQSLILFGHAGIHREDPDFITAFVMNDLFGSGRFGTRLMRELRERRGLTYGAGSWLASNAFGDVFQGRVSTDNARAGEVVALLREEWAWLAGGGVSAEELESAQTYLTGAYPLRFEGNASIARILASMQLQGFDIDYVNRRNDLVRAVTLEDIHRVAARLADPEALHFVIVGRPEGLEEAGL